MNKRGDGLWVTSEVLYKCQAEKFVISKVVPKSKQEEMEGMKAIWPSFFNNYVSLIFFNEIYRSDVGVLVLSRC